MSDRAEIVFLSMYWAGGGAFRISDSLAVVDWVNREILARDELERALNFLLAVGLVEIHGDAFTVPEKRLCHFDEFRKKVRKDRFDTVRLYFAKLPAPSRVPHAVCFSDSEYKTHVRAYHSLFRNAPAAHKKRASARARRLTAASS